MSDERMAPAAVAQTAPIHHATVFGPAGYSSPTTCGRTEQPKPATDSWALVSCLACIAASDLTTEEKVELGRKLRPSWSIIGSTP